jgi:integrase
MVRKKGSRNRGFWFRAERGWYVGDQPLLNSEGKHIRNRDDKQAAEQAYHALMANGKAPKPKSNGNVYTVRDICREYLKEAKERSSKETLTLRRRFLVDFCEGKTESGKRVHKGYGDVPVDELIGLHIKRWLEAHNWNGSRRMAYQAVRRAFHYGKELGMVPESKTLSFKAGSVRKRKAYFDKATEETIYATANRALADVIRALIGTGCRPGEVARLETRHIEERDGRMVWRFAPSEHKTGSKTQRDRVVRVCSEIATLVKHRIKWQTGNRVFLNSKGKPWTSSSLKDAFTRLRKRLIKKGIKLGPDQTLYACRHTYAKRQLGKGVTTEVLAAQMGNSRQIAWEHYGKDWDRENDNSLILWSGID